MTASKIGTTIADLLAVNGQSDDQEPWCAADECPSIDIHGEDLVVLCNDGVARWTNSQREWTEVDMVTFAKVIRQVYESGSGGNLAEATQLLRWMSEFYEVGELGDYLDIDE